MKYLISAMIVQLFTLSVYSATITSRIHSIDKGKKGQPDLILLENGHTAFLEQSTKSFTPSIENSLESGDTVEIEIDEKRNVLSIQTVAPKKTIVPKKVSDIEKRISYDPTIVTLTQAKSAFTNMRRDYQNDSQCYNRAHVWSYEEYQRSRMKSGKLFLFFTSRYIRNFRYKWWFHVTPFAFVGGTAQSNWRTLDRRFTGGPLKTKTWTDIFMHNNAVCPVVYRYSHYQNRQEREDCYLIPVTMYYWQPRDIENEEITRYVKKQFFESEVDYAYWEAF